MSASSQSPSMTVTPLEEHGGWSDRDTAPPGPGLAAPSTRQRRLDSVPAPLFCLAAMLTVQTGIALSTPLFPVLGVAGTTSLRLLVAAAVLLAITRPRLRGRGRRDLGAVALLGVASAGMTLMFAGAVDRLPMGTAATIEFLGPLAVALLFARRVGHVLWALLAGFGVVLLTLVGGGGGDGGLDPLGLVFAVGAAICLGGYILLTHKVGSVFTGFEGLALSLTVAALVTAPLGLPEAARALSVAGNPWLPLLEVAGVALLFPLLPYMLEMTAVRRLGQRVFSVIASMEPAVSALVGLVVLSQHLTPVQLAGIACVIAASAGTTLSER